MCEAEGDDQIAVKVLPMERLRFDALLNCANYLHLIVDGTNEIRDER